MAAGPLRKVIDLVIGSEAVPVPGWARPRQRRYCRVFLECQHELKVSYCERPKLGHLVRCAQCQ